MFVKLEQEFMLVTSKSEVKDCFLRNWKEWQQPLIAYSKNIPKKLQMDILSTDEIGKLFLSLKFHRTYCLCRFK